MPLRIQNEIVYEQKELLEAAAGIVLNRDLIAQEREHRERKKRKLGAYNAQCKRPKRAGEERARGRTPKAGGGERAGTERHVEIAGRSCSGEGQTSGDHRRRRRRHVHSHVGFGPLGERIVNMYGSKLIWCSYKLGAGCCFSSKSQALVSSRVMCSLAA